MFNVNIELFFIMFIFIIYICIQACFANLVNYIHFFNLLCVFAGQRSPPKFSTALGLSTIFHHSFLKPIKIILPTSSRSQSPSRPSSQTSFFALASGTQIVTTSAHLSGCIRLISTQSAHQQCSNIIERSIVLLTR